MQNSLSKCNQAWEIIAPKIILLINAAVQQIIKFPDGKACLLLPVKDKIIPLSSRLDPFDWPYLGSRDLVTDRALHPARRLTITAQVA